MKLASHQKTRFPFIRKEILHICVLSAREMLYNDFFRDNQWNTFPYLCRKKHDQVSQNATDLFCVSLLRKYLSPYGFYLNVFVYTWTILRNAQPVLCKWNTFLDFTVFPQSKRQWFNVHRMNLIMHRISLTEQLPKTYFVLHFSCRKLTFSFWCIWLSEIMMLFTEYLLFLNFIFFLPACIVLFQWKIQDAMAQEKCHLCSWCQM